MAASDAPSPPPQPPPATAEPGQTTPLDPSPLPPAPAPASAHSNAMARDLSDAEDVRSFDTPDADLPPLPTTTDDEDSFLQAHNLGDESAPGDESIMMDREMKRQLMDLESSFLPEASVHPGTQVPPGADDTYLFGGSPGHAQATTDDGDENKTPGLHLDAEMAPNGDSSLLSLEPPTPAGAYKTPAVHRTDLDVDDSIVTGDSNSEALPSSPSADAARRNQSRGALADKVGEEAKEGGEQDGQAQASAGAELKEEDTSRRPTSSASTVKAPEFGPPEGDSSFTEDHELSMENITIPVASAPSAAARIAQRPSFLQHRQSSQRSSVSSFTNHSDVSLDGGSTGSLGADFALQSGGAVPRSIDPSRTNSMMLSRLPSLSSIVSSASGYSEPNHWDKTRSISANSLSGLLHPDHNLERLDEETHNSNTPPETPRAPSAKPMAPTDTVIAKHVQNIQVPDTIAREFREKHGRSPEKRHMATPFTRNKHNLTLKEQNSKIDKLSKENFDLKLKIHFLDEALQNRSDENVKETISKNVQLQTDLANEKKDNLSLRKKVRELEKRLKVQEEGDNANSPSSASETDRSETSLRQAAMEEEIEFLKERLVSTETTVEHWRQEAFAKEAENRRFMDYIKNTREKGSSEDSAAVDETIRILTDDLEEERVRREQAEARLEQGEAEREQLRDEIQRLREQHQQGQASLTNNHVKQIFNSRKIYTTQTTRSNSGSDVVEQLPTISIGGSSSTYVEQLQVDNEKLQRDLHAQASMLTSRNRENLRLREENEGLKLTIRRGDVGSIAGDSILERSISRNHMRSVSRASHATRMSQVSDPERDREREDLEAKCSALRDELSQAKLQYKELDDQLNGHLDLLEQTENKVQELQRELEAQTEDLQALSNERDEVLESLQEKDQECEDIRQQALETIQRLEGEIEQKEHECHRLVTDLENVTEDFNALQQEMKNVSESLLQLEDDRDASLRKIQNLEAELEDANQELVRQDKLLSEEKSKTERLEIQIESCQGEIDFLREEQEGDKIKIGELESNLNNAHVALQDEKERFRDLEERITEERHQRDVLDSQEKQEVEKVVTDLNAQLAKVKDENRKLRKNLSQQEVEAAEWKRRLDELENNLREALGSLHGTRTSMLKDVHKLQRDLETTMQELDNTKQDLAEKDRLLRNRDTLLESTGLESRRLADMLERERQARRQDQAAFDNAKRGHQSVTRTIQQHETRVLELETIRSQDRQKLHALEKQYREQLQERNNLLYALWNRLSTLCGAEWSRNHSLVNGELPSMELISKNIQGFNKNIILAVKNVEGIIGGFRQRIRGLEKDLTRDYQTLEHTLDVRVKRLEKIEQLVRAQRDSIGRVSTIRGGVVELNNQELTKLRNENKTLRTEVTTLRAITVTTNISQDHTRSPSRAGSPSSSKRSSMAHTLLRGHSTSAVEGVSSSPGHPYPQAGPLQTSEQKWIHRLRELERRLKAEREARLLDRSGARKRLEEKVSENDDLRAALERERDRKDAEGSVVGGRSGPASRNGSRGPEEDVY